MQNLDGKNIKWDLRFLSIAKNISKWSLDPSTKVGAVIVDSNNRIISTGYNGLPSGIKDSSSILDNRELKYRTIIHAEENAILYSNTNLNDAKIYVYPLSPCLKCSCMIIQSGIKTIITYSNKNPRWDKEFEYAKQLFNEAGVNIIYYDEDLK